MESECSGALNHNVPFLVANGEEISGHWSSGYFPPPSLPPPPAPPFYHQGDVPELWRQEPPGLGPGLPVIPVIIIGPIRSSISPSENEINKPHILNFLVFFKMR